MGFGLLVLGIIKGGQFLLGGFLLSLCFVLINTSLSSGKKVVVVVERSRAAAEEITSLIAFPS
ncbi:hypothetical protein AB4298_20585 [Shewanella sp. 10N.261.52.F9]|uniref:hypothetical protein n=1 Tax=Shewanella sp. 10N.261.52.F9 TaxID=3229684 RepID=UPI00354EB18A